MPTVKVVNRPGADGAPESIDVRPGATVLSGARTGKKDWRWYCGGQALCGTCSMLVVEGELDQPGDLERYFIEGWGFDPSYRLGCQARVRGDARVVACGDEGFDRDKALAALAAARKQTPSSNT